MVLTPFLYDSYKKERNNMKQLLIAPDSFKESMSALEAANAIEQGFKRVFNQDLRCVKLPMADGGEGTSQSLHDALNGRWKTITVTGPLGYPVHATYSIGNQGKTAVIEMAEASGLGLVPIDLRNPLKTTTYGTGELIIDALNEGVTHIILGIGGSATNDGGAGCIQALGGRLRDEKGREIPFGGGALQQLASIDLSSLDERLKSVQIEVACDVDNPLLGDKGATFVYGPQKGATSKQCVQLESALSHYHDIIKKFLHRDVSMIPGAGAAGGFGAGLLATLNIQLKPGIDVVLSATQFEKHVKQCDLVITGEGKIDAQTIFGKTPIGVAKVAQAHHKPVIAVAGTIGEGYEAVYEHGIDAVFSIASRPMPLSDALSRGPELLERWAFDMAQVLSLKT